MFCECDSICDEKRIGEKYYWCCADCCATYEIKTQKRIYLDWNPPVKKESIQISNLDIITPANVNLKFFDYLKKGEEIPQKSILNRKVAKTILNNLRVGVPPSLDKIHHLNVNLSDKLDSHLNDLINNNLIGDSYFVYAPPGMGKSHFINNTINELLIKGYSIAKIELSSNSGIRFNRFDQIAQEILNNLQFQYHGRLYKFPYLFEIFRQQVISERGIEKSKIKEILGNIHSEYLRKLLFVWLFYSSFPNSYFPKGFDRQKALERIFFLTSNIFNNKCKEKVDLLEPTYPSNLYHDLIKNLKLGRSYKSKYYANSPFNVRNNNYRNAWNFIKSLTILVHDLIDSPIVFVFEEFEDILNLNNVSYFNKAIDNLSTFFQFIDTTIDTYAYFVITSNFYQKTMDYLSKKLDHMIDDAEDIWLSQETFNQISLKIDDITPRKRQKLGLKIFELLMLADATELIGERDLILDTIDEYCFVNQTIRDFVKNIILLADEINAKNHIY
ncbi:MAG: hypothetical protein INQ03_06265 [Candidatus Heimdallarchaeota archaeon]|nr:hypothetical protein [Candidatus Heimdallarchaeota archaeon]